MTTPSQDLKATVDKVAEIARATQEASKAVRESITNVSRETVEIEAVSGDGREGSRP